MKGLIWQLAVRFERPLRVARLWWAAGVAWLGRGLRALPGTSWRFGPPRHYTYDTLAWSQAGATQVAARHDVDASWRADRVPVRAGQQAVPHQFVDSLRWPMPPTFVLTLDDARLWGPDGVPVTVDDTALADQTNRFGVPPEHMPVMRQLRMGSPRPVPGVSATIAGAYADSYYHWMFDLLPRLDVLRRSGVAFDRVITPDTLSFQRETLAAAGVGPDRRLSYTGKPYLRLERLQLPSAPGTPGQTPPAVCDFLRGLFADSIRGREPSRRLFLSRSDANRRKPANEDALLAALRPLGFVSVTMAGRTVAEQATLFAEAEVIVAPHGGALTNLVFCQRGAKVVELFPPGYTPVCFWTITDALELEYRPLFDTDSEPHDGLAQWAPYAIDPARVLTALTDLGVTRDVRAS